MKVTIEIPDGLADLLEEIAEYASRGDPVRDVCNPEETLIGLAAIVTLETRKVVTVPRDALERVLNAGVLPDTGPQMDRDKSPELRAAIRELDEALTGP